MHYLLKPFLPTASSRGTLFVLRGTVRHMFAWFRAVHHVCMRSTHVLYKRAQQSPCTQPLTLLDQQWKNMLPPYTCCCEALDDLLPQLCTDHRTCLSSYCLPGMQSKAWQWVHCGVQQPAHTGWQTAWLSVTQGWRHLAPSRCRNPSLCPRHNL